MNMKTNMILVISVRIRRGHVAQAAERVQWSGRANERRPPRAHPESSRPTVGMVVWMIASLPAPASFLSPPVGSGPGRPALITSSTRWIAIMPCAPQNAQPSAITQLYRLFHLQRLIYQVEPRSSSPAFHALLYRGTSWSMSVGV
jgi:hypothetical protein